MNDERLDKLFAAARQEKPDTTRSEYGFETRLMARLREKNAQVWTIWAWRLMPAFAAVVIALGTWDYIAPVAGSLDALAGGGEEQLLVNHLLGE